MKRFHFSPITYFLFTLTLFLVSCGGKEKSTVDSLYDEVIEAHDVAMERMGEIVMLSKRLKDLTEAEIALEEPNISRVDSLSYNIELLNSADEAMMNWMRNFKANMEGMTEEEQIKYLSSERDKIDKVKDQMFEAIDSAKQLLGEE